MLWHGHLGSVFQCLGEYVKAGEYCEKGFSVINIGDRAGEAASYEQLADVSCSLETIERLKNILIN